MNKRIWTLVLILVLSAVMLASSAPPPDDLEETCQFEGHDSDGDGFDDMTLCVCDDRHPAPVSCCDGTLDCGLDEGDPVDIVIS